MKYSSRYAKLNLSWCLPLLLLLLLTCNTSRQIPNGANSQFDFIILQLNDVYEIAPLEGGKAGGLARVATVRQELLRENPNVITIMAGDFLSPSFVGTLKFVNEKGEREKIAGLQMIETLNAMGLDYATFGNHEFDLSDPVLLEKRIAQCEFAYTVCNVSRVEADGSLRPFRQGSEDVPETLVHELKNKAGASLKVGFLGVILPFAQQDYLQYADVTSSFRAAYDELKKASQLQLAITHQNLSEDLQLAADVPGIPLFIGGHEHANLTRTVGQTLITKADANAKTVYIHRISYDAATGKTEIQSELKTINDRIPEEAATKLVVDKWQNKAFSVMTELGYEPDRLVLKLSEPLVCKESLIRTTQTNYGKLTMDAIARAIPGADAYLLNSGSMRLDDNLVNVVTEYDVLRTYPFGGDFVTLQLPGKVLRDVLEIGSAVNYGEGGYLQLGNVVFENEEFLTGGKSIVDEQTYSVVLPSFVAKGREANLEIFADYYDEKPGAETFIVAGETIKNDLRDIVISHMRSLGEF